MGVRLPGVIVPCFHAFWVGRCVAFGGAVVRCRIRLRYTASGIRLVLTACGDGTSSWFRWGLLRIDFRNELWLAFLMSLLL